MEHLYETDLFDAEAYRLMMATFTPSIGAIRKNHADSNRESNDNQKMGRLFFNREMSAGKTESFRLGNLTKKERMQVYQDAL